MVKENMTYRYEFTRLLVSDFKACFFLFYQDVMGFQVGFGPEDDTYADFVVGEVNISLFDRQEMSETLGTYPPRRTHRIRSAWSLRLRISTPRVSNGKQTAFSSQQNQPIILTGAFAPLT
jgi:hypothetical protein